MSAPTSFPFPVPAFGAEPYWAGCNDGKLTMQRCSGCSRFRWLPSPICSVCGSAKAEWRAMAGRGRITTWTVITHPVHPAAVDRVPYVVAEVELEEQTGLRMITNLVGIEPDAVSMDLAVEVEFEEHPSGQKLPVFRPIQ